MIDVLLLIAAALGTIAFLGTYMCGFLTDDAAKELHYLKLRLAALAVTATSYAGLAISGEVSVATVVVVAIVFACPTLTAYPQVKTRAAIHRENKATAARIIAQAEAERADALAAEYGLPTVADLTRTPAASEEQQP